MTEYNLSNLLDEETIKRFKAGLFEYDDMQFVTDTMKEQEIDSSMTVYLSHPFKWVNPIVLKYSMQGESPPSTPVLFSDVICSANLELKTMTPYGLIKFADGCKKIKMSGCTFPKGKELILDFSSMKIKPDIEISESEIEHLSISGKSIVLTKVDIVNEGKLVVKDCPNLNVVSVTGDDEATCGMEIDNTSAVVITYAGVSFNAKNGGLVKSIKDITIPLERDALEGENVFNITTASHIYVPAGMKLFEPTATNILDNTVTTTSSGGSSGGNPMTSVQPYSNYSWLIEIENIHKGKIVRYTYTRHDGLIKRDIKFNI